MVDLYWERVTPDCEVLYAGASRVELGWISLAKKHWGWHLLLPIEVPRAFAPQDEMRRCVAHAVTDWFERCATHRPAVDNEAE